MTAALIAILARIPFLAWPLVAALLWGGVQTWRLGAAEDELLATKAADQAVLERTRATYAAAAASAADSALAETKRRIEAQQEATRDAEKQADQARADATAADAAARKLRERFAATAASACRGGGTADTAAAGGGPPAADPGLVLADVQRRLDEAAGELGRFADAARAAGLACQRSYDALTAPAASR